MIMKLNSGEGCSDQICWSCLLPAASPGKSQKPHGIGHLLNLLPKRLLDLPTISGVIPRTACSRQIPMLTYLIALKEFCLECFFRKGSHCI